MTKKELIIREIDELVVELLFERRKGDKNLPIDAIEQAIVEGEIELDEMAAYFKQEIMLSIYEYQNEQRVS